MLNTTIPAITVVLLTTAAEAAKLPTKFVGDWCPVNSQSSTYERGRWCFRPDSDAYMTVTVNGFRAHETDCRVLSVSSAPLGKYHATFKCWSEGDTSTQSYRMSLDNKGRLIMR
jgi:hypothetical protein